MTVLDDAGEGSAKACWALMRGAERTCLGPQAKAKSSSCLKNFCLSSRKTGHVLVRTRPRARRAGTPAISNQTGGSLDQQSL